MTISDEKVEYNDAYETCDRTYAELRIYTGELNPAIITQRLGIKPSEIRQKGVLWTTPSGRERPAKKNAWFLSSEATVNSRDLRRHIDWLLTWFENKKKDFQELITIDEIQASIWIIWWSAHGHGGPTLAPKHLNALGELGIDSCFDLYFSGDQNN